MRVLLEHPSADPAAMLAHTAGDGWIAYTMSALRGHVDAMRLLLDHPCADPADAMLACTEYGYSALKLAAAFASDEEYDGREPGLYYTERSFAPLLFLLRRITVQPQPCDAQRFHMNVVVERLMRGEQAGVLFDDSKPDDARDECVRLLIEFGADNYNPSRHPVFSRIIREALATARVPRLINEAVVGMAVARCCE
jgi:hypothetical protein